MDILSEVLGEAPEAVVAPEAEAPAAEPAEQSTGPVRGPDGKFVSAQAAEPAPQEAAEPQTPAPAAPVAPVDPAQPPQGFVPLAALQELRGELKGYKEELRKLQTPAPQQRAPEPAPLPPSVFEDENGFTAHFQGELNRASLNIRLDVSEDLARTKYDDATVDAVQAWFGEKAQVSPTFRQEVLSQRNPYEYAIAQMKREQALADINTDEFAQFQAWRAAQSGQAPAAATPPTIAPAAPAAPRAPTPSLASASSAGGFQHVPAGPGQAFDQTFKGP